MILPASQHYHISQYNPQVSVILMKLQITYIKLTLVSIYLPLLVIEHAGPSKEISPYTLKLTLLSPNQDIQLKKQTMSKTKIICLQENNKGIHDITSLLNIKVTIEKSNKKTRPAAMAYGHAKNYYNHDSRCAKYSENQMNEYTRARNSFTKWALYALDHTTNIKRCPAFNLANKKSISKI